jgi:hypothetical protein
MTQRRLVEGKPWRATFDSVPGGKDTYHGIIVVADTLQDALLAIGEHLPKTDCKLSSMEQMSWVRGVIV